MITKLQEWLKSRFKDDEDSQQPEPLHIAAAMLLLEVGRADFETSEKEKDTMTVVLKSQFALNDEQVVSLMEHTLSEQDEYTSAHPFIKLLNEGLERDEKQLLMEGCWHVALSDAVLDKYEEYSIRKIADWLYVSHSEFIRSKEIVKSQLGLN
jgi:uncharacterized tellurite resistance protein B-like protein